MSHPNSLTTYQRAARLGYPPVMAAAAPLVATPAEGAGTSAGGEDQLFVVHDVSWEAYETILSALGDRAGVRVTYCEGVLELMSPGGPHEERKTILARLIEAYA